MTMRERRRQTSFRLNPNINLAQLRPDKIVLSFESARPPGVTKTKYITVMDSNNNNNNDNNNNNEMIKSINRVDVS